MELGLREKANMKNIDSAMRREVYYWVSLAINSMKNFPSDREIPDHKLKYFLRKAEGMDGLVLDSENKKLFDRIVELSEELE